MNILFICKFNRFRSKLAEAFLNRSGGRHRARSAGIIRGLPIDDRIKRCAKRNNVTIRGGPRTVDIPLLRWQDMIVIVADDVPRSLFESNIRVHGKRLRQWRIHDTAYASEMDRIAKAIENKVSRLLIESDK